MSRPVPVWNLDADFLSDLTTAGDLQTLLDLIGRFTLWVDPAVARAVPIVFPKTARVPSKYLPQGWLHDGVRHWTNQPAEAAFFSALDSNPNKFTGLVVCHIYPGSAYSPRHFTRLSNLFVIPKSLYSFISWEPVLAALEWRAFELYGYKGPRGKAVARPTLLPRAWAGPLVLDEAPRAKVIAHLRHIRATRPMYATPRGTAAQHGSRRSVGCARASQGSSFDLEPEALHHGSLVAQFVAADARDLEAELWDAIIEDGETLEKIVAWIVRHARFPPPAVIAACPNPFPKTRRARWWRGERVREVKDGITLTDNAPCWAALIAALGASFGKTRGALADHAWQEAAYLPAHNAHLAGLVLVPKALGSLVDAAPIRAVLQRHMFERTGYRGPHRRVPGRPAWMPAEWPENVHLTLAREARAIQFLTRDARERPGFFRTTRTVRLGLRRPRPFPSRPRD